MQIKIPDIKNKKNIIIFCIFLALFILCLSGITIKSITSPKNITASTYKVIGKSLEKKTSKYKFENSSSNNLDLELTVNTEDFEKVYNNKNQINMNLYEERFELISSFSSPDAESMNLSMMLKDSSLYGKINMQGIEDISLKLDIPEDKSIIKAIKEGMNTNDGEVKKEAVKILKKFNTEFYNILKEAHYEKIEKVNWNTAKYKVDIDLNKLISVAYECVDELNKDMWIKDSNADEFKSNISDAILSQNIDTYIYISFGKIKTIEFLSDDNKIDINIKGNYIKSCEIGSSVNGFDVCVEIENKSKKYDNIIADVTIKDTETDEFVHAKINYKRNKLKDFTLSEKDFPQAKNVEEVLSDIARLLGNFLDL